MVLMSLKKYEKKIENGELPEHPPYEDFLSALTLKDKYTGDEEADRQVY